MNLANELRNRGVTVHEVGGWQTRGRPYTFRPVGVMVHHTAGSNSLRLCIEGTRSVPGPLCQFLIHKNGTVYLISQGYANHAGAGSSTVLNETKQGVAPNGDARDRGLKNDTTGNAYYWGIEVENLGTASDPYPPIQLEMLVRLCAALCDIYGYDSDSVVHHREWTNRKVDMSWRGDVRGITADRLASLRKNRRKYKMLVYGKRGTPDFSAASAGVDLANRGVATSNLEEAREAVRRGEPVIAVGKPAIDDLGFSAKAGRVVRKGNKVSVFGNDGLQTLGLLENAIRDVI